jgi:OOP family OmpA-OmpF porin
MSVSANATPARASGEPDGEFGLLVGASRADNGLTGGGNKVGTLLGLRWGSRLSEKWNWFADAAYSSYDRAGSTDLAKLYEGRTGLEYYFSRRPQGVHWFLSGALGLADIRQPAGFESDTRPLISAGIGLAQLTGSGGPRIEVRDEALISSATTFSNLQLVLGWSFGLFGKNTNIDLDSDGDGVPDRVDECANTPRGARVDARGCPIDSDGDGVYDGLDQCPGTPRGCEVDKRGCPIDTDRDGVCDGLDKCPGTPPGTKVDKDGCPERKAIFEPGKKVLVLEGVNFAFDSAELTRESYRILDRVVTGLNDWPEIRVEIGGHTDSDGADAYNLALSQRRAESVRAYFVSKGIKASRLEAKGYGETQPVTSNDTAEGRAKNRRVELKKLD